MTAQAGEAGTAETRSGSVHEHAVPQSGMRPGELPMSDPPSSAIAECARDLFDFVTRKTGGGRTWDQARDADKQATEKCVATVLASATGPSHELDARIYDAVGRPGDDGPQYFASLHGDCPPAYTRSLDAAMSLVPEGCDYLLGRGRLRKEEREFGAIIYSPDPDSLRLPEEREIGACEHPTSLAISLCAAALRARSQEPGTSEEAGK